MMADVVATVEQLAPGVLGRSRSSVACISTTRPKYLVFGDRSSSPACVVEFGDRARLQRTHEILSELSARAPGQVPRSLCCAPWHNGTHVHIQEGQPGMPWFRLADGLTTADDWRMLLERATSAMLTLHAATRQIAEWTGTVCAGVELRRQARICESETRLPADVSRCIGLWSDVLDAAGPFHACWQHGDFSLNNLLVTDRSMVVIDFEEFGATSAPLHDAFGLALSVPLSQEGRCPLSRAECLAIVLKRAKLDERVEPEQAAPLLMHHLLWRINQCAALERRAALRAILHRWVGELAAAPEPFFGI